MLWAAALLPVLILHACNNASNRAPYAEDSSYAESSATAETSAPRDVPLHASSIPEKRVKSADMRLRVDDVVQSVMRMEQVVRRAGGVIEESEIKQSTGRQHEARYTTDSLRRVTLYKPEATLRLRVPVSQSDSVANALTQMAAFVEHRTLKDTDMSLKHLHNKLLNDAARKQDRPVDHTKQNKELDVRQYEEDAQRGAIGRSIENLGIEKLASFSTLTVSLTQPDLAVVSIIPDPERLSKSYFATDAGIALRGGLDGFLTVFVFFLSIWPLLLVTAITWFAYRKWYPKLKSALQEKPKA